MMRKPVSCSPGMLPAAASMLALVALLVGGCGPKPGEGPKINPGDMQKYNQMMNAPKGGGGTMGGPGAPPAGQPGAPPVPAKK
jgi:hypothetical protein